MIDEEIKLSALAMLHRDAIAKQDSQQLHAITLALMAADDQDRHRYVLYCLEDGEHDTGKPDIIDLEGAQRILYNLSRQYRQSVELCSTVSRYFEQQYLGVSNKDIARHHQARMRREVRLSNKEATHD